jgi:hypothetical protein
VVADVVRRTVPVQLTLAAALAALEGLVALGFGVAEIGVSIFMVGFAVLLGAAARGLLHARRWARAPVVVVQLILLPVGWSFRGAPTTAVSAAMIIAALLTLVLVLHPRSTRALVVDEDPPDRSDGDDAR